MRRGGCPRLRRGWRVVQTPVLLALLYLLLWLAIAVLSQRQGFGSPGGLGLGYVAVSAVIVVLRIVLIVVMPIVIAFRATAYLVTLLCWAGAHRSRRTAAASAEAGT